VPPQKAAVRQVQVPTIKAPDKKVLQQHLPVRLQAKVPIILLPALHRVAAVRPPKAAVHPIQVPTTLRRVAIVTLLLPVPAPVVAVPLLAQAAVSQVEVLHAQVVVVAVLPQVVAEGENCETLRIKFLTNKSLGL
jgi:hypothetical protein